MFLQASFVCVCVCAHVHMCAHVCVCLQAHLNSLERAGSVQKIIFVFSLVGYSVCVSVCLTQTDMHTVCTHTQSYIHMHRGMQAHMRTYLDIQVHAHVYSCTCTFVYTHP